jgi:3-dehydroquinate dehydratase/shikimate dehydrogenase
MSTPALCLSLTGKTLQENLAMIEKYRKWIDVAELRADFLDQNERLHIRRFPEQAGLPCILTIRRKIDGGCFLGGEANRTLLFAHALAFADSDLRKNFAYVDFESDFFVPSLQDAALAFGTRIIRSVHDTKKTVTGLARRFADLRLTGHEISKIACTPQSLAETTQLFREAQSLSGSEHILCAMGPYGAPTRILASRLHSAIAYASPKETLANMSAAGHFDPETLEELYYFHTIDDSTAVCGVCGFPLEQTLSPELHNPAYHAAGLNAVYIPLRAETVAEALDFAQAVGVAGLSVTVPHKETVLPHIRRKTEAVERIGACNTLVADGDGWIGYNTDASGLSRALLEFLGTQNLSGVRVAIIGAGGAARAAAFAVKQLNGTACVFNRTITKARQLAEPYGFQWAPLSQESLPLLEKYGELIIQTTAKGLYTGAEPNEGNDPLYFYSFSGTEALFDVVYLPEVTPVMARAQEAGCRVSNGYLMLKYQGEEQIKLFSAKIRETQPPKAEA